MKTNFIFIILVIIIASCADPYLRVSKLGELEIDEEFSYFMGDNSEFNVDIHSLHNLDNLSNDKNKYKIIVYETLLYASSGGSKKYTFTALTFENNKLIYFGYPEDYHKSPSSKINLIGEELISIIDKIIE